MISFESCMIFKRFRNEKRTITNKVRAVVQFLIIYHNTTNRNLLQNPAKKKSF